MMSKQFFSKKDELILSMVMLVIVGELIYQGIFSLCHTKSHTIFQNNTPRSLKK